MMPPVLAKDLSDSSENLTLPEPPKISVLSFDMFLSLFSLIVAYL